MFQKLRDHFALLWKLKSETSYRVCCLNSRVSLLKLPMTKALIFVWAGITEQLWGTGSHPARSAAVLLHMHGQNHLNLQELNCKSNAIFPPNQATGTCCHPLHWLKAAALKGNEIFLFVKYIFGLSYPELLENNQMNRAMTVSDVTGHMWRDFKLTVDM